MNIATDDRRARGLALLLALATVAVFVPTWGYKMLYWDDDVNVLQNPLVLKPGLEGLKIIFTSIFSTDFYPLTYISLALDHWIWNGNFAGYHVTQTILHGINAGLVLLLVWRWTKNIRVAALAGALFGWHPIQVETVAWVAERKNALGLCFVLLTWLVYLRGKEVKNPTPYRLGAVVLFTAAVLSHALVIILPLLLFAYEMTLGNASFREALRRTWLFFIPSAFASLMRVAGHASSQQLDSQFNNAREKIPTMFAVLGQYVTCLVWPHPLNNYYVVHGVNHLTDPGLFLTAGWILIWAVIYWRVPELRRWTLFALAWFLIALLPVSQLVPHPTIRADRYLYVAAIGVFTLAGLLLSRQRILFGAVTVIALAGCLCLTCQRMPVWHDPKTLWGDCVAKNPHAVIGFFGLASSELREANYPGAELRVRQLLAFKPNLAEAHEMLGGVLLLEQRYPEARGELERALVLNPDLPDARYNLSLLVRPAR